MMKKICGILVLIMFISLSGGCKNKTGDNPEKTESVSEEKISVYKPVEEYSLYENDYVEIDGVRYTNSNIGLIATKVVDKEITEIELPSKFNITEEVYGDDLFKEGTTLQYGVDLFIMGYADGFITEDNKIENVTFIVEKQGFYNNCINNKTTLQRITIIGDFDGNTKSSQTPFVVNENCEIYVDGPCFDDALVVFPSYYRNISLLSPYVVNISFDFEMYSPDDGYDYFYGLNLDCYKNMKFGNYEHANIGELDMLFYEKQKNEEYSVSHRSVIVTVIDEQNLITPLKYVDFNFEKPVIELYFDLEFRLGVDVERSSYLGMPFNRKTLLKKIKFDSMIENKFEVDEFIFLSENKNEDEISMATTIIKNVVVDTKKR